MSSRRPPEIPPGDPPTVTPSAGIDPRYLPLPGTITDGVNAGAGPFERLAKRAPDDVRNELHGNMTVYLSIEYVTNFMNTLFTSAAAKEAVLGKVAEFQTKTRITGPLTKVPFRFGSFKDQEPLQFKRLLGSLIQKERSGKLLVIGNGGAGVAGFLMFLANDPRLADVTIIWNGGNSDVNFKAVNYLHGAITYEPHIEMKEGLQGLDGPLPVFINKLAMFIPVEDPLALQESFSELEEKGALDNITSGTVHEKIMKAMWRSVDDCKVLDVGLPGSLWYASRYNHSAIGEHDNAMWCLGTSVRANKYSNDPVYSDSVLGKTDSLMDRWTSTCIARLPSWYPPSILEDSISSSLYHLNDTAFLIANSHRISSVLQYADGSPVVIDNPAHLWWSKRDVDSVQAKKLVEAVVRDRAFIERWDTLIRSGNGIPDGYRILDLPAFEYPDPARDYSQEYLKLVHEVQKVSRGFNLIEWVHLSYSDAVYAKVVIDADDEGGITYKVDDETTHRMQAKLYLDAQLAEKRSNYTELVQILRRNRMNSVAARAMADRGKRARVGASMP